MIRSRYFPDAAECLAEKPRGGDKIEIPADVYDSLGVKEDFILRGAYPYEAAKIIAKSKLVAALRFDETSGEIKTTSQVGISAEMDFAFALWNFYDKEAAIERVILSRINSAGNLPAVFSNGAGEIQIQDGVDAGKNLAKAFAKASAEKSALHVKDDVQEALSGTKIPQVFEIVSSLWDDIVLLGRNFTDIKDFANGRISGKQLIKNVVVTNVGVFGKGAGYAMGATVAIMAGAPAILAFGAAVATGYFFKLSYSETAKDFLDKFSKDDRAKMLDTFGGELSKMLSGKFFTMYEIGLLMEAIRDDLNAEALKQMYASGSDSARAEWARKYISCRLDDIYKQRKFIGMPSKDDWNLGFNRLRERLANGGDIVADMENQRTKALAQMQAKIAEYKLKLRDLATIMPQVNEWSKISHATEQTIIGIQNDNRRYEIVHQQQLAERAASEKNFRNALAELESKTRRTDTDEELQKLLAEIKNI